MEASSSVRQTLRNCLSWKKHLAQTASMCCSSDKSGVKRTPRTRVTLETLMVSHLGLCLEIWQHRNCNGKFRFSIMAVCYDQT